MHAIAIRGAVIALILATWLIVAGAFATRTPLSGADGWPPTTPTRTTTTQVGVAP